MENWEEDSEGQLRPPQLREQEPLASSSLPKDTIVPGDFEILRKRASETYFSIVMNPGFL